MLSPSVSSAITGASPGKRSSCNKVSLVVIRLDIDDEHPAIDCQYECASSKRARRHLFDDDHVMDADHSLQRVASSSKANDTPSASHRGGRSGGELVVETFESPVAFTAGNPFVQKSSGLIHLYKQDTTLPMMSPQVERSDTIVMLTVPAWMSAQELLQFLQPMSDAYVRVRIVRDKSPQNYMVIVNFRSQSMADTFYRTYNTAQYNSIEPNLCHLAYVERVEVLKEGKGGSLPIEGHTELPTCTVCLERMDESVDGILTILCNHSFHSSCLAKWTDESCPVCRYSQTPEVEPDHACSECRRKADLWICLICGHVGCGRYEQKHAYDHFVATSHTFSLQVGTARVWDYAGDSYVHRLVAGNLDGKPVQVDRPCRVDDDDHDDDGKRADDAAMESEEKLEGVTLEYSYLLTSQLEDQRRYFEGQMTEAMEKQAAKLRAVESSLASEQEASTSLQSRLEADRIERTQGDRRHMATVAKLNKTIDELKDEREMNKLLRDDQQRWSVSVGVLEKKLALAKREHKDEVAGLEEQLRDMMFHLSGEEKIKAAVADESESISVDEVHQAHVEVGPANRGRKKKK